MKHTSLPLPPGAWLGMMGGGQLGRMFCHAAQALGYQVAVLDPAQTSPAGVVANRHICAAYDDRDALDQLAQLCSAVSTEFENIPAESLRYLAQSVRVCPAGDAVAMVQDRLVEKAFIGQAGVPLAPYAQVLGLDDLAQASDALFPGILKSARLGYDGKGQVRVTSREQAHEAFIQLGSVPCVLEALQALDHEISVVVVRDSQEQTACYPASRNAHRDGILALSVIDGLLDVDVVRQATGYAEMLARQLDYQGVMCVEFFVLQDARVLANEIAPRPHNSGHATQDACLVSQFEQQVRVMAGLPIGTTQVLCPVAMLNVLGDLWFDAQDRHCEPDWAGVLAVPGTRLHLYGKAQARKGRKMGHINILGDDAAQLRQRVAEVERVLGLPHD
ncbi:5-(carboxyamino)imidazole ribonucleotide synthase [Alcaligenaceae bacterium CGII-47]|nr:5-(carboxyamino)imidazole ribonucleotide synthase [Alcaligenaceae bacterium CGII-47]